MRPSLHYFCVFAAVAVGACATSTTLPPDDGGEPDASTEACQTLAVDMALASEPLGVACTLPSGAATVASPCNREVIQTRELTADGTSIVHFDVAPEAEGWNLQLEIASDGCAKVRRMPFSDMGAAAPTLATRATIDVSIIPSTSAELETMGGQLEARFADGSRFLAQF